jgi:hypothetical protein
MNSREKGKRGERDWRDYLRAVFGLTDARRGVQYAGGNDSPDVVGGWPGTHCEVKRVERFTPHEWIGQAVSDGGENIPYVAHRQNGAPWLVTVRAVDLLAFAKIVIQHSKETMK